MWGACKRVQRWQRYDDIRGGVHGQEAVGATSTPNKHQGRILEALATENNLSSKS